MCFHSFSFCVFFFCLGWSGWERRGVNYFFLNFFGKEWRRGPEVKGANIQFVLQKRENYLNINNIKIK